MIQSTISIVITFHIPLQISSGSAKRKTATLAVSRLRFGDEGSIDDICTMNMVNSCTTEQICQLLLMTRGLWSHSVEGLAPCLWEHKERGPLGGSGYSGQKA